MSGASDFCSYSLQNEEDKEGGRGTTYSLSTRLHRKNGKGGRGTGKSHQKTKVAPTAYAICNSFACFRSLYQREGMERRHFHQRSNKEYHVRQHFWKTDRTRRFARKKPWCPSLLCCYKSALPPLYHDRLHLLSSSQFPLSHLLSFVQLALFFVLFAGCNEYVWTPFGYHFPFPSSIFKLQAVRIEIEQTAMLLALLCSPESDGSAGGDMVFATPFAHAPCFLSLSVIYSRLPPSVFNFLSSVLSISSSFFPHSSTNRQLKQHTSLSLSFFTHIAQTQSTSAVSLTSFPP